MAPPADDPDVVGPQEDIVDENGCIYIPDVVMNREVHFFDIPRLGAFFAAPIIVQSYLNDQSFDDSILKIKAYREQVAENETIINQKKEEYREKIENLRGVDDEECKRLTEEFEGLEWEEVPYPEFEFEQVNFVVCCDTLGKDREINREERDLIFDISETYRKAWEGTELRQVKQDAERYIAYQLNEDPEERVLALAEAEERDFRNHLVEPADPSDQMELHYREEEARRAVVAEQLLSEVVMRNLLELGEYNHLKHWQVVQNALILLGYTKKEINKKDTNILDWRRVRAGLYNQDLIKRIISYQYQGPKTTPVPKYAEVRVLQERLSRIGRIEVIKM